MCDEVVKFLGGAAILTGAVAWFIRSMVVHILSRDIAGYKQSLKVEAEKELAQLKSDLEVKNSKLLIKMSALQNRRIEFLQRLYERIARFSEEANYFAVEPEMGAVDLKEKADMFIDAYFDFYKYFESCEILVSRDIEKKIKLLHESHFRAALDMSYKEGDELSSAIQELQRNYRIIGTESEKIRCMIKEELRGLIGIES